MLNFLYVESMYKGLFGIINFKLNLVMLRLNIDDISCVEGINPQKIFNQLGPLNLAAKYKN